jgi:hypothetical protein
MVGGFGSKWTTRLFGFIAPKDVEEEEKYW